MAHGGQERAFRLVGRFGGGPALLQGFHRLLVLGDISQDNQTTSEVTALVVQ